MSKYSIFSMQTLRQFLESAPPTTTRDKVGLTVYYLQNFGGEDYVTTSDIDALFDVNNISMGESAIAAHLQNLHENGLLLRSNREFGTGYYLSTEGMTQFERFSNDNVGSPPPGQIPDEDLSEYYGQLYERTGRILSELEQQKDNAKEWRQSARRWRIGSVILSAISLMAGIGINWAL